MGVVDVQNLLMTGVTLLGAEISFGGLNQFHPQGGFLLGNLPVKAPGVQKIVGGHGGNHNPENQEIPEKRFLQKGRFGCHGEAS